MDGRQLLHLYLNVSFFFDINVYLPKLGNEVIDLHEPNQRVSRTPTLQHAMHPLEADDAQVYCTS